MIHAAIAGTIRGETMSNKNEGQTPALKYKRIVAKIGTNVLTAGTDRLNMELMADFAA